MSVLVWGCFLGGLDFFQRVVVGLGYFLFNMYCAGGLVGAVVVVQYVALGLGLLGVVFGGNLRGRIKLAMFQS